MALFTYTIPVQLGSIYTTPTTGVYTVFSDCHNAPNGTVSQPAVGTASSVTNIAVQGLPGRGSVQYRIARTFGYADLSAYAPNITSIGFRVDGLGTIGGTQSVIVCAADAFSGGSSLFLSGTDMDVNGAWNINTPFSSATTFQNSSFTITGNAAAVSAANNNQNINFIILNYTYDYLIVAPPVGRSGFDLTSTVDLTANQLAVTGVYQSGYPNDVNGVVSGNVGSVNGILSSNIQLIIGV
jgi:hypothetical protein